MKYFWLISDSEKKKNMSVLTALRNTPKGQLHYSRNVDPAKLKEELDTLSPPPLSRSHEEKESCKMNLSFGLDAANFPDCDLGKEDFNENCNLGVEEIPSHQDNNVSCGIISFSDGEEKSDLCKDDILIFKQQLPTFSGHNDSSSRPQLQSPSLLSSSEFGYTSCAIIDAQKEWEQSTQVALSKRQAEFEHHERSLKYLFNNKQKEMMFRLFQQANHRQSLIDRKQQEGLEEGNKRRQRLKENHEEHQKKIYTKHKEIEIKRELWEEQERRKKEKMARLHRLWHEVDKNRENFNKLHDSCQHKSSLPDLVEKHRAILEKVCSSRALQIQEARHVAQIDDLLAKCEEDLEKSCQVLGYLSKQIEETQQKIKLEEERQKEEANKKAEAAANAKKQEAALAQDSAVLSLAYILKERETRSQQLSAVEASIQPFIDNVQNKSFRFSLQRAVNTPINAISDYSGPHLLDKIKKLKELLSGQSVDLSRCAEASLFCQNLVAKMLVRKGEEQVTSKHESAFPIGMVVVAMWVEFPSVGELFQAHLQSLCPYVLPFYSTRQNGQSSVDYHRCLGYKVSDDGTVEEQDKFLRRMSGLMRLYCSCMVAHLPPGVSAPHPHGLDNAWKWLARTMNLEPHADVTAAMIYDVLSVTGHALFREYRVQFAKLLHLLYKSYLPKLESVSVTSATLGRLKILLESAMQTAKIALPEGLLSRDFYFQQHSPA